MKTLELFSGTASFSQVMLRHGHTISTYDNDPHADELVPGTHHDVDLLNPALQFETSDILWASPPCQAFSVAAMGRSWVKETKEPRTETARIGMLLLERTIAIIAQTKPATWFIENPRGFMRKKIEPLLERYGLLEQTTRHTVTYCQYGDTRMKPTDIWTSSRTWKPRAMCKNGMPCHEAAPRGAKTGTQGVKGARNRSRIPLELFEDILEHAANRSHDTKNEYR